MTMNVINFLITNYVKQGISFSSSNSTHKLKNYNKKTGYLFLFQVFELYWKYVHIEKNTREQDSAPLSKTKMHVLCKFR